MCFNRFNVYKRCPSAYYRMEEASGHNAIDQVCGHDLSCTGAFDTNTGYVGAAPLARKQFGNPISVRLERSNAERLFSIQLGGTVTYWFRFERNSSADLPSNSPIFFGDNTLYKCGTLCDTGQADYEWTLSPSWPGGAPQTYFTLQFTIAYNDNLGFAGYSAETVSVAGSDFTPSKSLGYEMWLFFAGRVKSDGSLMTVSMGTTDGSIIHKSVALTKPVKEYVPTNTLWLTPNLAEGFWPYIYDDLSFHCCYLSDTDLEWIFNNGIGRVLK